MPVISITSIYHTIVMSFLSIIFFFAYRKRKELKLWFLSCTITIFSKHAKAGIIFE